MLSEEQKHEYEEIRDLAEKFFVQVLEPHYREWEIRGHIDRSAWESVGGQGLLCSMTSEKYGGGGGTFLHAAAIIDGLGRSGYSIPGFFTHSDIIVPYIESLGTEDQKRRYLPGCCSGEIISSIAITEPDAGSDMRGIRTRAVSDGDGYVINGSKTFITNGWLADIVIVVANTPTEGRPHAKSLFIVPTNTPGFSRGRILEKVGQKAQDTAELYFEDVRVDKCQLLGEYGKGLNYLMKELPQERLIVGVWAQAVSERAFDWTLSYQRERKAFGNPLLKNQATRHTLAAIRADLAAGRALTDQYTLKHLNGTLTGAEASIAKLWLTEMQGRCIDGCLQLFGGNGYMREYPIARAYEDARAQRIYGGTSEIMKELIARDFDA